MLGNNNNKSIRKLTIRSLKANKMTNIFSILAIALTTLLITTTITGAITFYKTNKSFEIISAYGIDADGYINVSEDSLKKLGEIGNIDKLSTIQLASLDNIKNKELLNDKVSLEAVENNIGYDMMAIVPMEGDFPGNSDEVLVPTWVLEALEVEKKVGANINLNVVIDNEVKTLNLKVSGYYDSIVSRQGGTSRIFVAKDFINKYNENIIDVENTKTAWMTFKNINKKSTFDNVKEEVKKTAEEIGAAKYSAHEKYNSEEKKGKVEAKKESYIGGILAILIVMLSGYFIIYNIFHISVTRDIKFYGLLKTIGTTSKQLKKIILTQGLILSSCGVPIGLILGYIVGNIIIPMALEPTVFGNIVEVKASPIMFISAMFFSYITVLISCRKPGIMVSRVSPIEAVKYVSIYNSTSNKKIKKGINGAKIYKMAWGNVIKNKKRVIFSVLSISLSAVIVIFIINVTMGISGEEHGKRQVTADIEIDNFIWKQGQSKVFKKISQDFVDKIKELDIVKEAAPYYRAITPYSDGSIFDYTGDIVLEDKLSEELKYGIKTNQNSERIYVGFDMPAKNIIQTSIAALNGDKIEKEVEHLIVLDGKIDKDEFKKGGYLIYKPYDGKVNYLKAGDSLPVTFRVQDENYEIKEVTRNLEIMAIVAENNKNWYADNLGMFNIEENTFKGIYPRYNDYIESVDIDLKDKVDPKEGDKQLNSLILQSGESTFRLSSRNFYREAMKQIIIIYRTVGGIIALILGIIGAINVINTMLTSIFSRKLEFAMLESIGMTKRQLKKYILFEGVYYVILASVIITPLGLVSALISPEILPLYNGFNIGIYLISITIAIVVIAILMITVPLIAYKIVSKENIIDRLRETE